jgi:hypothetical protein
MFVFFMVSARVAYMICQSLPELAVDERYDATWVFWCAAMVLAIYR